MCVTSAKKDEYIEHKKRPHRSEAFFVCICGADGARTRDLLRDRQAL